MPGDIGVPEAWIGNAVLVLSHTTGETLLPKGGYSLVGEIYSGELRSVSRFGVSLMLRDDVERQEGSYYPGGDTFFPWSSVVRITLAISVDGRPEGQV
jgi:hypothetical protein